MLLVDSELPNFYRYAIDDQFGYFCFKKCKSILQPLQKLSKMTIHRVDLVSYHGNTRTWDSSQDRESHGKTVRLGRSCKLYLKADSHFPKKVYFISFSESSLKRTKNAFYSIWKALFVLKIFKFLSWLFAHIVKTAWL